jgi:hypothetical protein
MPIPASSRQQELDLQLMLGHATTAIKGYAAPEVEQILTRALELCEQVGDTPQRFPMLRGLCWFYVNRGALPKARELGEQLYCLAQCTAAPTHLLEAHEAFGGTLFFLGEYAVARMHLEQGIALGDPTAQPAQALRPNVSLGAVCLVMAAIILWCLGYPAQAVQRSQEISELEISAYGIKYTVRGTLNGPNGRTLHVVTVWISIAATGETRFVTLFPDR